jgi:hypothetical protein
MLIGKNKPVDLTRNEQYTPKWIFDRMGIEFDLDVAAPIGGAPHVPARRFYSQEDDGLAQAWEGLIWMNPPYSNAKPWVEKFIKHQFGIALLPLSKSQWFWDLWRSADGVLVVPMDVKFEKGNGKPNSIFMQTGLFAMGMGPLEVLNKSGIGKVR